jgi:hypothetical protein
MQKRLTDILIIVALCVVLNLIMRPNIPEPPPLDTSTTDRLIELEAELNTATNHINTLRHEYQKQLRTNEQTIERLRRNRHANNYAISTMSSVELTNLLRARYADSTRQHGDTTEAAGGVYGAGLGAGGQ